jgi:hypothetical protein
MSKHYPVLPDESIPQDFKHRNFTLRHFKSTITRYLEGGYQFRRFGDVSGANSLSEKTVLLRHDIDVDPVSARKMLTAQIELGIRSTVFIRTSAQTYDLDDPRTLDLIGFLKEHGFGIGIHLDISPNRDAPSTPLDRQVADFASVSRLTSFGMSTHQPSHFGGPLVGSTANKLGLSYEAYDKQFTSNFKYLSDSSRRWREGCFCQWINVVDRLQVLIHPIWWKRGSGKMVDWVNSSI